MKKMSYKTAKRIMGQKLVRAVALIIAGYSLIKVIGIVQGVPCSWTDYLKTAFLFLAAVVIAYDKDRYLAKTHGCRSLFLQK